LITDCAIHARLRQCSVEVGNLQAANLHVLSLEGSRLGNMGKLAIEALGVISLSDEAKKVYGNARIHYPSV
jgi:hypothetical protein